jgi:hypothetical protein
VDTTRNRVANGAVRVGSKRGQRILKMRRKHVVRLDEERHGRQVVRAVQATVEVARLVGEHGNYVRHLNENITKREFEISSNEVLRSNQSSILMKFYEGIN